MGCCFQDFFYIARNIPMQLPSSCFSMHNSVHVVHPYSSMDKSVAWKKCVLSHRIGLTFI